jgi:CheY-like chemotaxis protein
MSPAKKLHFIVIDDSKLDCFIAEKIIKNTGICESIKSFLMAQDALDYIREFPPTEGIHTIMLVDIQMPVMNGFQFVEEFEKLPIQLTENYSIYIISSSINDTDLKKVHNFESIRQFLNKPLTSNNLSAILRLEQAEKSV